MHFNENMKRKNSEDISSLTSKKFHTEYSKDANENELANNATSLIDLPLEILGKITAFVSLKDLFNLERVNKKLRNVALNIEWPKKSILNKESINYGIKQEKINNNQVSEKLIQWILSRGNIKHLDLSFCSDRITNQICFQLYRVPKLRILYLCSINLTSHTLMFIGISCPLLEYASFRRCFREKEIDKGLELFFKSCQNLKSLDLAENSFSGECFDYIPRKVGYLNLNKCPNITSNAMELLSNRAKNLRTFILTKFNPTEDVNIWLKNFTKLRFLNISWLNGNFLSLDFSHLQDLEMLCLRGNSLVNIETLESLENCTKLKGLDLTGNRQLDGISLDVLKSCKALKYCDFSWLERLDNGLVDLVQTLKLEYLAINQCNDLPEDVLKSLINDCNSLSQLEIFGDNFNGILSSALSEKCTQRSKILKLSVKKGDQTLLSNNWCEILSAVSPSSFPTFFCIYLAIFLNNAYLF